MISQSCRICSLYTGGHRMSIDPSCFHPINVTDTCSVWNVLSSVTLYRAALAAQCHFCVTGFVNYECLIKPRSLPTDVTRELQHRLEAARCAGQFEVHSCNLDDLQIISMLEGRKRLGKGELSSIAFAMGRGLAVLTDDQGARKLSSAAGNHPTQTTPHLHSWLVFTRKLDDSDHSNVLSQHLQMEGSLARHLQDAYFLALQCARNALPPL